VGCFEYTARYEARTRIYGNIAGRDIWTQGLSPIPDSDPGAARIEGVAAALIRQQPRREIRGAGNWHTPARLRARSAAANG